MSASSENPNTEIALIPVIQKLCISFKEWDISGDPNVLSQITGLFHSLIKKYKYSQEAYATVLLRNLFSSTMTTMLSTANDKFGDKAVISVLNFIADVLLIEKSFALSFAKRPHLLTVLSALATVSDSAIESTEKKKPEKKKTGRKKAGNKKIQKDHAALSVGPLVTDVTQLDTEKVDRAAWKVLRYIAYGLGAELLFQQKSLINSAYLSEQISTLSTSKVRPPSGLEESKYFISLKDPIENHLFPLYKKLLNYFHFLSAKQISACKTESESFFTACYTVLKIRFQNLKKWDSERLSVFNQQVQDDYEKCVYLVFAFLDHNKLLQSFKSRLECMSKTFAEGARKCQKGSPHYLMFMNRHECAEDLLRKYDLPKISQAKGVFTGFSINRLKIEIEDAREKNEDLQALRADLIGAQLLLEELERRVSIAQGSKQALIKKEQKLREKIKSLKDISAKSERRIEQFKTKISTLNQHIFFLDSELKKLKIEIRELEETEDFLTTNLYSARKRLNLTDTETQVLSKPAMSAGVSVSFHGGKPSIRKDFRKLADCKPKDRLLEFLKTSLGADLFSQLKLIPEDVLQHGGESIVNLSWSDQKFSGLGNPLRALVIELAIQKFKTLSEEELKIQYVSIRGMISDQLSSVDARLSKTPDHPGDREEKTFLENILKGFPGDEETTSRVSQKEVLISQYPRFMGKASVYADIYFEGRLLAEYFGITLKSEISRTENIIFEAKSSSRSLTLTHNGEGGLGAHWSAFGFTAANGNCLFNAFAQALADIAVRENFDSSGRVAAQKEYLTCMVPQEPLMVNDCTGQDLGAVEMSMTKSDSITSLHPELKTEEHKIEALSEDDQLQAELSRLSQQSASLEMEINKITDNLKKSMSKSVGVDETKKTEDFLMEVIRKDIESRQIISSSEIAQMRVCEELSYQQSALTQSLQVSQEKLRELVSSLKILEMQVYALKRELREAKQYKQNLETKIDCLRQQTIDLKFTRVPSQEAPSSPATASTVGDSSSPQVAGSLALVINSGISSPKASAKVEKVTRTVETIKELRRKQLTVEHLTPLNLIDDSEMRLETVKKKKNIFFQRKTIKNMPQTIVTLLQKLLTLQEEVAVGSVVSSQSASKPMGVCIVGSTAHNCCYQPGSDIDIEVFTQLSFNDLLGKTNSILASYFSQSTFLETKSETCGKISYTLTTPDNLKVDIQFSCSPQTIENQIFDSVYRRVLPVTSKIFDYFSGFHYSLIATHLYDFNMENPTNENCEFALIRYIRDYANRCAKKLSDPFPECSVRFQQFLRNYLVKQQIAFSACYSAPFMHAHNGTSKPRAKRNQVIFNEPFLATISKKLSSKPIIVPDKFSNIRKLIYRVTNHFMGEQHHRDDNSISSARRPQVRFGTASLHTFS